MEYAEAYFQYQKNAKHYDKALEYIGRHNQKLPEVLEKLLGVELSEQEWHFFEVFDIMSNSRSIGMALGPIPFTEMRAVLEYFKIDADYYYIRSLQVVDSIYLKVNKPK